MGTDLVARITRKGNAGNGFVLIEAGNAPADAGIALFTDTAGDDFALFMDESDARKIKFATTVVDTDAQRNANTKVTLQQDGKLGIGTTAPSQLLDIASVFTFDATAKVFTILQSAADPANGTGAITLRNSLSTSLVQIAWQHNNGTFISSLGHSNAAGVAGGMYWDIESSTSAGLTISSAPGGTHCQIFSGTANGSGLALFSGNALGNSAANSARLRYTTTGQKSQLSHNGGGYFDVGTYAAALTTGSVLFANASNQIAQDNPGFKYTSASRSLMIGTDAVTANFTGFPLTLSVSSTDIVQYMWNTNTAGFGAIGFLNNARAFKMNLGYGNSASPAPYTDKAFVQSAVDLIFASITGPTQIMQFGFTPGATFVELTNGSGAAASAANTGRFRYTTTGQKAQLSKNTGAYEDIATLATAQTFTKSQNVAAVALTDAVNIATDASLGNTFTVTLTDNRTLANPTNLVAGGIYNWIVSQDAVGGRTLAYGALFKWSGGAAPVITATANAKSSITAIYDGTALLATFTLDYA